MAHPRTRTDREPTRSTMSSSGIRPGAGVRSSSTRFNGTRSSSVVPTNRHLATASRADRMSAQSPAESTTIGTKRKERDFEAADVMVGGGEETNINVVVRCRGRSQREVKENSTVVVNADGVKGQVIELSMGANALSNKTYSFDRVFSPAADQSMVFDDVVKPILEEMLAGYNCTIFAYGQTGTGKTYTMSGDMSDTLGMLSDEAGIIPRVLQQLFDKLENENTDNCVKCSFIELYNEELRDLLSTDENTKLKIYDDASRRGHATTLVQGMEEKHIKNAAEGIKVLQEGSLKRQVAATKCNDLSSRSHTVFTITAYVKSSNDQGVEELVSAGKLNLVDLAGSENIQRSGAENKRATEAGLINKSLLTLGRVINALVDHSPHIPYRESKLTRLLQDSLGGRTKTCIIATISPSKSNLEETISTLEYAFRAKNIRNKPQMHMITKKMLLRDFTVEIEKLKSELISTRQRNGVYLSNEMFEEMTAQSESRRIVLEEKSARLETLEANLRNKVQELFSLNISFMGMKKDHEATKAQLDETQGVLDQTDIILAATRKTLAEETERRKAHEETEEKLTEIGSVLIDKLQKTVKDVNGLHAKNKRKSDLHLLNRTAWNSSQSQVAEVTSMVERRVRMFQEEQQEQILSVSRRMETFVQEELQKLSATQAFLDENFDTFAESKRQLLEQKQRSKEDMDEVLEEIKEVRDNVKERVGESLQAIAQAAEKIAGDVLSEMTEFHDQLHTSYSSLGKDFKSIFEELVRHITTQRCESDNLRRQLQSATNTIMLQNANISTRMQEALEEERRQAAEERQKLLSQISALITSQAEAQESRFAERTSQIQKNMADYNASLEGAISQYGQGMDAWDGKEGELLEEVKKSRDQLKTKLKDDWNAAEGRSNSIRSTANQVHAETVRVVGAQIDDLDVQMEAMDDFVARAKSESNTHHETHMQSIQALSNTVDQSFGNISAHFKTTFDRVKNLGEAMELDASDLHDGLEPLSTQVCQPLSALRDQIGKTALQDYRPTGETPQKAQYQFPTSLPRTETPNAKKAKTDGNSPSRDEADEEDADEDNDTLVFADLDTSSKTASSPPRPSIESVSDKSASLREVNPNISSLSSSVISFESGSSTMSAGSADSIPLFKRSGRSTRASLRKHSLLPEGRENLPMTALAESMARRKSPRMN
ncbi:kinesin-like protein [Trichoderma citrinoviride]|uniref:Kinesin-like protein n=1 Tax=Trichoderma citrinoviride TaxID=58853 RepID=A0A2T4BFX8_9HYPO|nr:kinesin-like protein [Trichoderma citrinoviride]PTB68212.1 kinesin-like protein [Trichoderma citrinoviride]